MNKKNYSPLLIIFLVSWTNGLEMHYLDKLYSIFGDDACISGTVEYTTSGPTLLKSDDGLKYASVSREEMETFLSPTITKSSDRHPVTLVHEIAVLNDLPTSYELIKEQGPDHAKIFTVKLKLGDESYIGEGKNHKEAKLSAAIEAIMTTRYTFPKRKNNDNIPPIMKLNNLASQKKIKMEFVDIGKDEYMFDNDDMIFYQKLFNDKVINGKQLKFNDSYAYKNQTGVKISPTINNNTNSFYVRLHLDDRQYYGLGLSKIEARKHAASKALEDINVNPFKEPENTEEYQKKTEAVKTPLSKLNEVSQRNNMEFIFQIDEIGLDHEKTFKATLTFGEFSVLGIGPSKKKAKQNAADLLLEQLRLEAPDILAKKGKGVQEGRSGKKKKKNKPLTISRYEKIKSKVDDVLASAHSYIWGSPENEEHSGNTKLSRNDDFSQRKLSGSKNQLLELTNKKGIKIQYIDVPSQKSGHFASLVSVGIKPHYVCIGEGNSFKDSQEAASFAMLKILDIIGLPKLTVDLKFEVDKIRSFEEFMDHINSFEEEDTYDHKI